ncbi:MAG: hypothetical protein AAFQ15_14675 [Pseudomonadota bacterium]
MRDDRTPEEICGGPSVTQSYFDQFDNDIYFPASIERVVALYTGRVSPKQISEGAIFDIWIRDNYSEPELKCWHSFGDKLASYTLAGDRTIDGKYSRSALFYLKSAARGRRKKCDINEDHDLVGQAKTCFDRGILSPFSSGLPVAHFRLYLCYSDPRCRFDVARANFHYNKARQLGVYEAQPENERWWR